MVRLWSPYGNGEVAAVTNHPGRGRPSGLERRLLRRSGGLPSARRHARALIEAVVEFARTRDVPAVEAYPVDAGGKRLNPSAVFPGTTAFFEKSGFQRVKKTDARSGGHSRWVMRKNLRAKRTRRR
jgi:GNAT superfamily N-acetyltransferase